MKVAREDPRMFFTLLGKIVPRELDAQSDVRDAEERIAALNRGRARARAARAAVNN